MDLCRTFSHFLQGTRPSRKARRVSSIVNHRKGFACCSQVHQYKLIVVPSNILNGLLTTLHLQLTHSTPHQLRNVFDWYFFALNSSAAIHYWTDYWTIHYWTMLHLSVVKDLTDQSPPTTLFLISRVSRTTHLLRDNNRKILIIRDVFSSFTTGAIIWDKTADSLKLALIEAASILRMPTSNLGTKLNSAQLWVPQKQEQEWCCQQGHPRTWARSLLSQVQFQRDNKSGFKFKAVSNTSHRLFFKRDHISTRSTVWKNSRNWRWRFTAGTDCVPWKDSWSKYKMERSSWVDLTKCPLKKIPSLDSWQQSLLQSRSTRSVFLWFEWWGC